MKIENIKEAYQLGYLIAIGMGSHYDLMKRCRESRPDGVTMDEWDTEFQDYAMKGYLDGWAVLQAKQKELKPLAEIAAKAFCKKMLDEEETKTRAANSDAIASIDAGVDELP